MKLKIEDYIHIQNEASRFSNLIIQEVPRQLDPFVGHKFVKSDRTTLLDKVRSQIKLPDFEPSPLKGGMVSVRYYGVRVLCNSLCVFISICFYGGNYEDKTYYCHYHDETVYLYRLDGQNLGEKYNLVESEILDIDTELKMIDKYLDACKEVEKLKRNIKLINFESYL